MSFTENEPRHKQGARLSFRDDGYVSKGSATKKFAVISMLDGSLLGYIKWFNRWRQYTFFPLGAVLIKECLREIADYCDEATKAHREKAGS